MKKAGQDAASLIGEMKEVSVEIKELESSLSRGG
jgi:hypothetical protein